MSTRDLLFYQIPGMNVNSEFRYFMLERVIYNFRVLHTCIRWNCLCEGLGMGIFCGVHANGSHNHSTLDNLKCSPHGLPTHSCSLLLLLLLLAVVVVYDKNFVCLWFLFISVFGDLTINALTYF